MAIRRISARMVKRLGGDNGATVVIAAGLSMGASLRQRDISYRTRRRAGQLLLENRLYLWFYYRHNGLQQLFYRKHHVRYLIMQKPTMSNVNLVRWGICWVILSGQVLLRGHLNMPIFNETPRCICQNRHGCDEHPQRDVCQRHFRLIACYDAWMFPAAVRQRLW